MVFYAALEVTDVPTLAPDEQLPVKKETRKMKRQESGCHRFNEKRIHVVAFRDEPAGQQVLLHSPQAAARISSGLQYSQPCNPYLQNG